MPNKKTTELRYAQLGYLFDFNNSFSINSVFRNLLEDTEISPEMLGGILVLQSEFNLTYDICEFLKRINEMIVQSISLSKADTSTSVFDYNDQIYYSYGNFFIGAYNDSESGYIYNKKCLSIEIKGISPEVLQLIAHSVNIEFNQKQLLVKDYKSERIYLIEWFIFVLRYLGIIIKGGTYDTTTSRIE